MTSSHNFLSFLFFLAFSQMNSVHTSRFGCLSNIKYRKKVFHMNQWCLGKWCPCQCVCFQVTDRKGTVGSCTRPNDEEVSGALFSVTLILYGTYHPHRTTHGMWECQPLTLLWTHALWGENGGRATVEVWHMLSVYFWKIWHPLLAKLISASVSFKAENEKINK